MAILFPEGHDAEADVDARSELFGRIRLAAEHNRFNELLRLIAQVRPVAPGLRSLAIDTEGVLRRSSYTGYAREQKGKLLAGIDRAEREG